MTCVWRRSMQRPYISLALCCAEEGTKDGRVREDCESCVSRRCQGEDAEVIKDKSRKLPAGVSQS